MKNQVKSIIAQTKFFRKIYRTHYLNRCRNHSPEQKINHKNKFGTECTALDITVNFAPRTSLSFPSSKLSTLPSRH